VINQIDSAWWYKLNGLARRLIVLGAYRPLFETILVAEYPKCGGTWLSQLLEETTGIPYPRNRLPIFAPMISHAHHLGRSGADHNVVIWRDGRDVMVSVYYHFAFPKAITSAKASERFRQALDIADPNDIERYFPRFLEWSFAGGFTGFNWTEFVDAWHGRPKTVFTSYEALHKDAVGEMLRILRDIGKGDIGRDRVETAVDKLSFESQAGRKAGDADAKSFLRKGVVGDWRNVFSAEARQIFDHHAGEALVRLGYEKDRSWVERDPK